MKPVAFILIVLSFIANSSNALALSVNATSTAIFVQSITVTKSSDLAFGGFYAPTSGSGTINQAGAVTGGVTAISSTRSAAVFNASGYANAPYTVTVPLSPTTITLNGTGSASGSTMSATLTLASGTTSRTLNGSGADSFTINGLLTVPAGKTQGTYVGSYDVTVSY